MNMGAAMDKDFAITSTDISSEIPPPPETTIQTQLSKENKTIPVLIQLHRLSKFIQKDTGLSLAEVQSARQSLQRIWSLVRTPEEIETFNEVREMWMVVRDQANAHAEKQARLSSQSRQTIDALYKRLQSNLTVAEIRAEFKPFEKLPLEIPTAEDRESLFKAKMALIRALKDAEAREHTAAWASSGSQDPQPPLTMSQFLKSQLTSQLWNLTMTRDKEAIEREGFQGAQAQSEHRLAQVRKEFEIMLNEEPSKDKKEGEVVVNEVPAMTQPQPDSQVIVKYLELKLQSRESEIESLNVKLDEQTKRSEETISVLTEELEATKNREKQLRAKIQESKRCAHIIDQNFSDYVNELTEEISTTKDILTATQEESEKMKLRVQNAEKLVEEMKAKIEIGENENCKFRDEVLNLEAMIQNMQINDGEKSQELNTEIEKLEQALITEKGQNRALKAENKELNLYSLKLENVRKNLRDQVEELQGLCELSISCRESKIEELKLNAEKIEKLRQEAEVELLSKIEEVEGLKEEYEKLVEKNKELKKSQNSDQANIDNLKSDICRIVAENTEFQRDSELMIKDLNVKIIQDKEEIENMKMFIMNQNQKISSLQVDNQKLTEQIENLQRSHESDRFEIDELERELNKMNSDYSSLQRNCQLKIELLDREAEDMKKGYERKLVAKSNGYKQCKEEKEEIVLKYEALKKLHESELLNVRNLTLQRSQQQEEFSSKLYAAEREIDQLTTEVYISEEKVMELKEEIKIGTDKHRQLIETYEDLKSNYAFFQKTANSKVESLEGQLRKTNEALSMEQDKLKHAEESIECLRKAANELKQLELEKSESEEKLKSELKKVTESLEKSHCEIINAAVLRQQLKDTIGTMEKQFNELLENYNEKSKLLAEIQNEKKEKQLEKEELEEQGYELFEF
ncbi:hypothetical protein CAEBREN_09562 [Caenorhabditis brenneri]|uniref:Uncharacterized protein n=1 Tax=Caenorhabditis brenneri TaxID=135651 RepID=G0P2R8_CAEBE|nr:hypothetical protein CAEBREN_09562 [Caenorhabditis brenneri]